MQRKEIVNQKILEYGNAKNVYDAEYNNSKKSGIKLEFGCRMEQMNKSVHEWML